MGSERVHTSKKLPASKQAARDVRASLSEKCANVWEELEFYGKRILGSRMQQQQFDTQGQTVPVVVSQQQSLVART